MTTGWQGAATFEGVAGRLTDGVVRWRQLGAMRGAAAALALATRPLRTSLRRARLRRRPLSASSAELARALGGRSPREALRGTALHALPTVRAFERELNDLAGAERASLIERAEAAAEHRFDLLGSGPVCLGERIDWQRDFKSGRAWPLEHISRIEIVYPDDSDIKVPWELSRFQHLPLLAAAQRLTGQRRWLDEIGAQLDDWIAANPVEFGANWACTMDVAIRAINWIAALAILIDAAEGEPWIDRALASLLLHGRFIRTHLEYAPVRGNHYLSNVVGLLAIAALFDASEEGRAWGEWASAELLGELSHQVRSDGCDHEASIPYHRLVTELFVCGLAAAEALSPGRVQPSHRARIERMLDFAIDYTRPDGLAPQVGDADDGRLLPLGDYARADPRSHMQLFTQAGREYRPASASAAYPAGGYWIMRFKDIYVLVRCGDVGVGGLGSHAHNDALSFELSLASQPLVVDPGSYLYTSDPIERTRFRSTAFHSTLQIDGAEQNPLDTGTLFAMQDRRRAELLQWLPTATGATFKGRHHGYAQLEAPVAHTRTIVLDGPARLLKIADLIASSAAHELCWTFPLSPCEAQAEGDRALARFPSGVRLQITVPGAQLTVEPGWLSPSYGVRVPTPFIRARRGSQPGEALFELELRIGGAPNGG